MSCGSSVPWVDQQFVISYSDFHSGSSVIQLFFSAFEYGICHSKHYNHRIYLSSTLAVTTRVFLCVFLCVFFYLLFVLFFLLYTVCRMDVLTVGRSVGWTHIHIDRRADGRTGREANEQLYKQTDGEMDARTGTNRRTSRQIGKTEAIHSLNVFQSWWQKKKTIVSVLNLPNIQMG